MSGRVGGSRVLIPSNVQKTIQDIREITGKQHGDDEIYAVLKDCAMDPNETAQKLLYLDTFHEVKGRRNRKKEILTSHTFEGFRSKQGGQGRVVRGLRGAYSSNYSDTAGSRNVSTRKENGVSRIAERTIAHSSVLSSLKAKNNVASLVTRSSTAVPNGPVNPLNGSSSYDIAPHSSVGGVVNVTKDMSTIDIGKKDDAESQASIAELSTPITKFTSVMEAGQVKPRANSNQVPATAYVASVSGVYSCSSDPPLAPSVGSDPPVGTIKREVSRQEAAVGQKLVEANKLTANDFSDVVLSKKEKASSGSGDSTQKKKSQHSFKEIENNQLSEMQQRSLLSTQDATLAIQSTSSWLGNQQPADEATPSEVENVEDHEQPMSESKQHVTFPIHFQVPEALKNGLTFGSLEANFGSRETCSSGNGSDVDSTLAVESSYGSEEPAVASNQILPSTGQGNIADYPQSSHYEVEKAKYSEGNTTSLSESKNIEPKWVMQSAPEGTQSAVAVPNTQNYSMNFMSTILGTHNMQFEGSKIQMPETSRITNIGVNPPAVSSQTPIPPLQSSISVSPQAVSLFRPPYAANYFPYNHYYHPIYLSPIHQFLGHNGFHQQHSASNMYLPPPAAPTGVKLPIPQFKPGTNAGNPPNMGMPSSSFISPSFGYAASPAVNTCSTNGKEDLAAHQLKENHIYTTGHLSEGSAVWIPAPGQDISSLQMNSLYNIPPLQGQNFFSPSTQASHGSFAGTYQPGQTVPSASTFMQQSRAVTGAPDPEGLSSGAYAQNWN